jgi:2,3-bisphosphoglycerate-dependent phosphoglycerate mutase
MRTLVLLRHGESEWNAKGLFTGWVDVGLSATGAQEASAGGKLLAQSGLRPEVVHTSVLTRAIQTANIALEEAGLLWLPVRRSWRLNERHYGALQGKDKARTRQEFGDEQFMLWRRSYDVPPPPIADDDEFSQAGDVRYADLPPEARPRSECLQDVMVRMLPYWYDAVVPDLGHDRAEHPYRHPARVPARRRVPAGHAGWQVPGPGCRRGSGRGGQEPGPINGRPVNPALMDAGQGVNNLRISPG